MSRAFTLDELADVVEGAVRLPADVRITGVSDVAGAGSDDATWVSDDRFLSALSTSRAGVVLVKPDHADTPMPAIECARLDRSVALLLGAFKPPQARPDPGVHAKAVVHPTAVLGDGCAVGACAMIDAGARLGVRCVIHPGAYVGCDTVLGADCVLWPNAVVHDRCKLGDRVNVQASAVIGSDGFGYYHHEGRHVHVPHGGGVILGDDVDVGSVTCLDRAKLGNTIVGNGS